MKTVIKNFTLNKSEYYYRHFLIVNVCLPDEMRMINKEMEVIACFFSLDKNIIEEDMFNTFARKLVKEKLKLDSAGLTNHIRKLITKGILSKNPITNRIKVKEPFIPSDNNQEYKLKIVLNEKNS
jgi:DNA replication protein DnaD